MLPMNEKNPKARNISKIFNEIELECIGKSIRFNAQASTVIALIISTWEVIKEQESITADDLEAWGNSVLEGNEEDE